ncbi:MAG: 30S ribosomal protein S2 [Bacteroidetes bacterium HGW-Bacteroidetes-9]|jgi:small subunit ribosomal protein S2|nr:MAG: 30S ribosomal protein S2 [Bacteroidetes bacterium HGW-Bacteroidetes-9]
MARTTFDELLDAGSHFGHLKRKWNPNMAPYIFMERNGIHIIDLYKTIAKIDEAASALKQITKSGKKVLFVATKKQAKEIVAEHVKTVAMPYVTERWPGGMLTNFATIRKAVRKMSSIDKMMVSPSYTNISKRERLQIARERAKLEKNLGSIADLSRLPAAIFVVDIVKEHIAIAEARKLNIPTFAIVDTNSDPNIVDFPIPANDDASKSISLIISKMVQAIEEGLTERKIDRDKRADDDREEGTTGSRFDIDDDDDDEISVTGERLRKPAPGAEAGEEGRSRKPGTRKPLGKKPGGPRK